MLSQIQNNKFIEKNLKFFSIFCLLIFFHFLFRINFFNFEIVNIKNSIDFLSTIKKILNNKHNLYIFLGYILMFLFSYNLKFKDFNSETKAFFLIFFFLFQFLIFTKHSTFQEYFVYKNFEVRYIIFFLSFLSLWRPAFLLIAICYCLTHSYIIGYISYSYNSDLDYRSLVYYISFLILGLSLLKHIDFFFKKNFFFKSQNYFLLLTFSIHIAVYFNSGIGKILLDPYYIFNNPTYNGTGVAEMTGWFTLEEYFDQVSYLVISNYFLINILVCSFQILSPLSLLNNKFLLFFITFFELQHILIALFSGVVFWKWIFFNLLFSIILLKFKNNFKFSFKKRATLVLISILMVVLFNLPRFAWLDSKYINDVQIIAVDKDNKNYVVPSNFFLDGSVIAAQHFPDLITDYTFNTYITGATENKVHAKKLNNKCDEMLVKFEPPEKKVEILKLYIKDYFLRYIKYHPNKNYNLFPHHIWSGFKSFKNFASLDKSNIQKIILNFRSYCLEYDENKNFYIGKNFSNKYEFKLF